MDAPAQHGPRPPRLPEDQFRRILDLYDARARGFRAFFGGLVGFALIFFFLVLLPYVSMQTEKHGIGGQLQALQAQLALDERRLAAFQQAQSGMEELRRQLGSGPARLRAFIGSLPPEPGRPPGQPGQSPPGESPAQGAPPVEQTSPTEQRAPTPGPATLWSACPPAGRDEWLTCNVRQEVLSEFGGYRRILRDRVIAPLRGMEDPSIDLAALERGLDALSGAIGARLDADPRFWHTFAGKVEFYGGLSEDLNRVWNQVAPRIERTHQHLTQQVQDLRAQRGMLEMERTRLDEEVKGLAHRLNEIQFPFGRIPVTLYEAIGFFPILLAAGFVVCSSLLSEATRLRWAVHRHFQADDPVGGAVTDRYIPLVAPLWIDPADPEQNRVVQVAMLSVPTLVFFVSCVLIVYGWILPVDAPGPGQFSRWLHGSLYVLGVGAFAYGYWQVARALRRYPVGPLGSQ